MKEDNKSKELINQLDMDSDTLKEKAASTASWFFSNLFSLLFPIGAVFLLENFEKNGHFSIKEQYAEMLMVTISISMDLIIHLNSKSYNINESGNILIRVVTVGIIVLASLAYGISKTIPEGELEVISVFQIALILLITAFVIGIACELTKKGGN